MFKIEKLILISDKNEEYTYLFTNGINYFQGSNDTGKTEFYDFLDYMFGSSEQLDLSKDDKDKKYEVIFNDPATILIVDGKKYISKAYEEPFDKEKGLLMCLAKANGIKHSDLEKMIKSATVQKKKEVKKEKKDENFIPARAKMEEIMHRFGVNVKKRGRPRKIKVGDKVLILSSTSSNNLKIKKMIGTICEVYSIPKGNADYYGVWQADKKEWWAFSEDEIKLVKD